MKREGIDRNGNKPIRLRDAIQQNYTMEKLYVKILRKTGGEENFYSIIMPMVKIKYFACVQNSFEIGLKYYLLAIL